MGTGGPRGTGAGTDSTRVGTGGTRVGTGGPTGTGAATDEHRVSKYKNFWLY